MHVYPCFLVAGMMRGVLASLETDRIGGWTLLTEALDQGPKCLLPNFENGKVVIFEIFIMIPRGRYKV